MGGARHKLISAVTIFVLLVTGCSGKKGADPKADGGAKSGKQNAANSSKDGANVKPKAEPKQDQPRVADDEKAIEAFEEICHLMRERMLIADLQSRYPPIPHVGLVAIGDMNTTPATDN